MSAGGGTVWITRAQPGAAATARRIGALGFSAVVDPLLEIRDLAPAVDLAEVAALAFTSANGVEAFCKLTWARDLPVFTVGEATAQAARAAGFADPSSADGDVEALARLIVDTRPGSVLCVGAREPAADLPALLAAARIEAHALAVYAAEERAPHAETLERLTTFEAVLLHSPRASRSLAAILKRRAAPTLRALCLSPAVAGPLTQSVPDGALRSVAFAPRPHESALLGLL